MDRWFGTEGRDCCAICSLANLILIKYNDMLGASRMYFRGLIHPLTTPTGNVFLSTIPELVSFATNGAYVARLYTSETLVTFPNEFAMEVYSSEQYAQMQSLADRLVKEGAIEIGDEFDVDSPCLILVPHPRSELGHALVVVAPNLYLDNGMLSTIDTDFHSEGVSGVVSLERALR
ncbi:MAG: hypothetical protein H6502_03340 [Candidatus Woesearchaeota archaeon]|nr:MAG: hypothetical protein H6502_03340 [Candidatus Woesearchaeota archaeon]